MSWVKKLIFIPPFLIFITCVIYFYQQILIKYIEVFFSSYGGLYEFGLLSLPLLLASLSFCLFITFTQDFKYVAILTIVSAFIPFVFLDFNLGLVISIGLVISLFLVYFNLQTNLKGYVHFQPSKLLVPAIKMLNTFLILTLAAGFYFYSNSIIQKEGFKIPDNLIDWAVDMTLSSQGMNFKGEKIYLAQVLTQEQIDLLKQNPTVLEQYGLTTDDLDTLSSPSQTPFEESTSIGSDLPGAGMKDLVKNQINGMLDQTLKPYLFVVPIILALMFYSLASLILWVLSFFLSPLISLIFYIFEKTGFITFEKEMREVKKIVI